MKRSGKRTGRILLIVAPLAAAVTLGGLLPDPAFAQQQRSGGLFERLFGPPIGQQQQRQQPQPQARQPQAQPRRQQAQPQRQRQQSSGQRRSGQQRNTASQPAPTPAVEEVAKSENARDVLVVGDFLAASLTRGLTDAMAGNRDIRIVGRANGSSGLVRNDYYDWLGNLPGLIEETDADLVVVMLGSNDRQAMRVGGASEAVRSEGWTAEYTRRTEALAAIVGEKDVPLVWVGMPPFQAARMTEDMVFLNDLYQKAAASVDGEFIDIWGGFVDASGAYTASGPDTAGQPARLRNSDGITMTAAGAAKLAYFAEKPIVRRLGLSVDDLLVSLAPQQLPEGQISPAAAAAATPQAPADIRSLPPISLADPRLDGGDALLGGGSSSSGGQRIAASSGEEGSVGRADSFNWTGRGAAVSPLTQENAVVFRGSTSLDSLRQRPAASEEELQGADEMPALPPAQ